MKNWIVLIMVFCGVHAGGYAQTYDFLDVYGGDNSDELHDLAIDKDGSIYISGRHTDKFVLGGDTIDKAPLSTDYFGNGFLAKLDSSRKLLWYKVFNKVILVSKIVLDSEGNVYFSVCANDSLYTPDTIVPNIRPAPIFNTTFILKYTSGGVFQWVHHFHSYSKINLNIDYSDNLIVNFKTKYPFTFIDTTVSVSTDTDFIGKINKAGQRVFLRKITTNKPTWFRAGLTTTAIDSSNNYYILSNYTMLIYAPTDKILIDPGYEVNTPPSSNVLFVKMDSLGVPRTSTFLRSVIINIFDNLQTSYNGQGFVMTGTASSDTIRLGDKTFISTIPNTTFNQDIFLAKFDFSGNCEWITGIQSEDNFSDYPKKVLMDEHGQSLLLYDGKMPFMIGTDYRLLHDNVNNKSNESILTKFSKDGRHVWTRYIEGDFYDDAAGLARRGNHIMFGSLGNTSSFRLGPLSTAKPPMAWGDNIALAGITDCAPALAAEGAGLTASAGLLYRWYLSDSLVHTGISPSYTPATTGWYKAEITDTDSCVNFTNAVFFDPPTGLASARAAASMLLYPNPGSDVLHIVLSEPVPGKVEFSIINAVGNEVKTWTSEAQAAGHPIDISGLAAGVYFIRAAWDNGSMTRRFVKISIE